MTESSKPPTKLGQDNAPRRDTPGRSQPLGRVVLVVEDEAMIRMGALDMVRCAGFEGIAASNADDAIRLLEARPDIHLVFTDISMPGSMDGLRLAHYVRNRWPPVLLIVVSGHLAVGQSELPIGAKLFRKPYSEAVVLDVMTRMFDAFDAAA